VDGNFVRSVPGSQSIFVAGENQYVLLSLFEVKHNI